MLWALLAVAIAGVVAGALFRVWVLVILSALTLAGTVPAALLTGWTVLGAVGAAFALLVVMQVSFLTGAVIVYGHRQKRQRHVRPERDAGLSESTS